MNLWPPKMEETFALLEQITKSFYHNLNKRQITAELDHKDIKAILQNSIDEEGQGLENTLREFLHKGLAQCMGIPHPLYFGLINSSPLPGAIIADYLISMLNNNAGASHQSPFMSHAENEAIASFVEKLQLPKNFSGLVVPGGSFANLQGILLARTAHFPEWQQQGPFALKSFPVIYTCEESHFSVIRAAQVAGFGLQNIVSIPGGKRGKMEVKNLEQQIQNDREINRYPFAVVATVGTTATGTVDSIEEIATLCKKYELWLHVDACYGAGALLLDKFNHIRRGVCMADSIALDPHKWFFVPMTAGLILTPHREIERKAFAVSASYIPETYISPAYCRGIPTSRRCSGFAIWMGLRAHGWKVIRDSIQNNIDLARLLEKLLRENHFTVLEDGELSICCARWEPKNKSLEELDIIQKTIADYVVDTGQAWFATTLHKQRVWLRFCITNLYTAEEHIYKIVDLLTKAVEEAGLLS